MFWARVPIDYDGEYLTWTTDGANAGSVFIVTEVRSYKCMRTSEIKTKIMNTEVPFIHIDNCF